MSLAGKFVGAGGLWPPLLPKVFTGKGGRPETARPYRAITPNTLRSFAFVFSRNVSPASNQLLL